MQVLGLIGARKGSKGIPNKNTKLLGGRPLITYAFAAALHSRRLTRTVLSTDGADIAALGRCAGIDVPFMRPDDLACDDSPATAYIQHCLEFLQRQEQYRPDIVVLLQPTAPLRSASDIDACVDLLVRSNADCVVSVAELARQYHPKWQFTLHTDGRLSPNAGSWNSVASSRQQLAPTYTRNGAVYAFRTDVFLRTGSLYGNNVLGYVMPPERSVNIDDMDDWRRAEQLIGCGPNQKLYKRAGVI